MRAQAETIIEERVKGQGIVPPKRKPGRPKGSKNKITKAERRGELREWLLSTYPNSHPLEYLAKLISTPLSVMESKYGLAPHHSVNIKVDAAKHLAPYLEQKLPVRVDVTEKSYKLVIGSITTTKEHVVDEQSGVQIKPIESKA